MAEIPIRTVPLQEAPSIAGPGCMLKQVLDLIGGKWKILILCAIHQQGTVRYSALQKSIFGITNTMLANSLKELEADGMVIRRAYLEMPLRVEYSLSERGCSIVPILLELQSWGETHLHGSENSHDL